MKKIFLLCSLVFLTFSLFADNEPLTLGEVNILEQSILMLYFEPEFDDCFVYPDNLCSVENINRLIDAFNSAKFRDEYSLYFKVDIDFIIPKLSTSDLKDTTQQKIDDFDDISSFRVMSKNLYFYYYVLHFISL